MICAAACVMVLGATLKALPAPPELAQDIKCLAHGLDSVRKEYRSRPDRCAYVASALGSQGGCSVNKAPSSSLKRRVDRLVVARAGSTSAPLSATDCAEGSGNVAIALMCSETFESVGARVTRIVKQTRHIALNESQPGRDTREVLDAVWALYDPQARAWGDEADAARIYLVLRAVKGVVLHTETVTPQLLRELYEALFHAALAAPDASDIRVQLAYVVLLASRNDASSEVVKAGLAELVPSSMSEWTKAGARDICGALRSMKAGVGVAGAPCVECAVARAELEYLRLVEAEIASRRSSIKELEPTMERLGPRLEAASLCDTWVECNDEVR